MPAPADAADVVVVGGGPAGSAAAITLAVGGVDVLLVDKARFPRDKCCGDGLTTAALRRLEALGLDPTTVPSFQPIEDVWVRSPSGRRACFPLPRHDGLFGAVARRFDLDASMLELARGRGVRVRDGHALTSASLASDHLRLEVEGIGTVACRYAIGADGMWSPLRKALGATEAGTHDGPRGTSPYLGEWHALRQYIEHVTGPAASQLWVWFEPDLLPGYAWSFPLPGARANVGFGVPRRPGHATGALKELWPDLLSRPHVVDALGREASPEAPHKTWPIPARIGDTELTAAGGRAIFVGDAARAPDSMTGEGIGQALETGELAAQCILAAGATNPGRAARHYAAGINRTLAVDDALARLLSRALAHQRAARGAVRVAGATDWTRRNFARWLFEDYPRAALATPRRWRRSMLTGPGAYRSP